MSKYLSIGSKYFNDNLTSNKIDYVVTLYVLVRTEVNIDSTCKCTVNNFELKNN